MDYESVVVVAALVALAAVAGCRKKVVLPPDAEPPGVDAMPDPLVHESGDSPTEPDPRR